MNHKKVIIRLILSLLFALIMLGLFIFINRVIKNKNLHISKILFTLHEKEDQNKNAVILKQKLREVESIQSTISSHLVDKKKPDVFVFFLEELGDRGGTTVDVKNISISKKESNTMNVDVTIEGSFNNVMKTISLLENTPYRLKINSINIDSHKKESLDGGKVEVVWISGVSFTTLTSE